MMTTATKPKLSEAQKDILDRVANRVMNALVHNDKLKETEAWNEANVGAEHKGSLSALYVKGMIMVNDHLTVDGITTAKEIWNETSMDGTWDEVLRAKRKAKEEAHLEYMSARKSWEAEAEAFGVPEGYEIRRTSNLTVTWEPLKFAEMPTIEFGDSDAPYYGHKRYEAPDWGIQVSGVGGKRDIPTIQRFMKALDHATTVLRILEIRYKDVKVEQI